MPNKKDPTSSLSEFRQERNTQTLGSHRIRDFFSIGFTTPGIHLWDWLFVLIFLVFGALFFLGHLQNNYTIVIGMLFIVISLVAEQLSTRRLGL